MITDFIRYLLLRRDGAGEPTLSLIEIDHDNLDDGPVRLVANSPGDDYTYSGDVYTGVPFDANGGNDDAGPPTVALEIPNVDLEIGRALETIDTPATATVRIVAASNGELIREFVGLELRDVQWNGVTLTGTLAHFRYDSEPWPVVRVTPSLVWSAFQ